MRTIKQTAAQPFWRQKLWSEGGPAGRQLLSLSSVCSLRTPWPTFMCSHAWWRRRDPDRRRRNKLTSNMLYLPLRLACMCLSHFLTACKCECCDWSNVWLHFQFVLSARPPFWNSRLRLKRGPNRWRQTTTAFVLLVILTLWRLTNYNSSVDPTRPTRNAKLPLVFWRGIAADMTVGNSDYGEE